MKIPFIQIGIFGSEMAITEQFHEYLYSGTFEVHSDNNPLTYVLTTAKADATGQVGCIISQL